MKNKLMMTPGPTEISEEVRKAMSKKITNPDLDPSFFDFYYSVVKKFQKLLHTENDILVMAGEGILGLESACASLVEPGDKVLALDNGIFGRGFADFAEMYGAEVEILEFDYDKKIDTERLKNYLKNNNDFKFATFVHCETPSGIVNPVSEISSILKKYNILTVVDSVSAIGGIPVYVDKWDIDIMLGGSQKCLSAPPGLTFLSISDKAWEKIANRKTDIKGFYTNLNLWKNWYQEKGFPYTQSISDIYALDKAVDLVLENKQIYKRHANIAEAVRFSLKEAGMDLYPQNGHSDTVTALLLPEKVNFNEVNKIMKDKYGVMVAGSLGKLKNMVLRIGHMGENCYEEKLYLTLKALDKSLRELDVNLDGHLHSLFIEKIQ